MNFVPNEAFWAALDKLIEKSEIVVDRPTGYVHPDYPDFIYRIDYGFLEGTDSSDGEPIDVWIGSDEEKKLIGVFCIVDFDKRDMEVKLLIGCTAEEIDYINHEYNDYDSMKGLLILRD